MNFKIEKSKMDFEMISPIPMSGYVTCTKIPSPKPIAEYTPTFREYTKLFQLIITKSGPGLMTANKWTTTTVKNSGRNITKLEKFLLVGAGGIEPSTVGLKGHCSTD